MTGGDGARPARRDVAADEVAGEPARAGSASTSGLDVRQARRRSTTRTAGSTSGRPAARTTTRGPRWRRPARSRSTGRRSTVTGERLVRPPVGRLHRGRRRRLGLVRRQPRRRHRPDAVARPRRRRLVPARLRDARRRGRHDAPPRPRRRSPSRSPTTGRARRRAPTTRPAGASRSRPRASRSTCTPTVADQELDTRATTGVVYWEGSQHVAATRTGKPLGGEAYVELTGYGPAG